MDFRPTPLHFLRPRRTFTLPERWSYLAPNCSESQIQICNTELNLTCPELAEGAAVRTQVFNGPSGADRLSTSGS